MEDFENLTKQEIKDRLETDLEFALNFMVDNQPDLIASELQANGSENVTDSDTAYNNLLWLANNNPYRLRDVLKDIPYDNSATNYTGHLKESVEAESQTKSWDWDTILAVAGTVLPVVAGFIGSGSGSGGSLSQAQIQQMEFERQKAEDERKARNNIYIIGGVIVAVFLVVLVITMNKKKGKK
jgi:hypothetical protein